jgi:glycolate oxidase iron-sulfur subunit
VDRSNRLKGSDSLVLLPSTQLTNALISEDPKLLACVHCGLCLEACPTYVVTGDENDGPRGRLYLMRAVAEGRLETSSDTFERHIDRCLGCRACESVCPAGVEYGSLLEASRADLSAAKEWRGVGYKLVRFALRRIWLHPARLKLFFASARLLRDSGFARLLRKSGIANLFSKRGGFALALLESSAGSQRKNSKRSSEPQVTTAKGTAILFTGCVGEGLFARVNRATERVLKVNGIEVKAPSAQVCCGALHAHAGDLEGARILARKNIEAFGGENETTIVTNAGGCGAMLATYGHLLADDPAFRERAYEFSRRIRDIGQELERLGPVKTGTVADASVTYDASCHLMYGQKAAAASLGMLDSIENLCVVPLMGAERCCGGAGIYNLLEPDLSDQVLRQKVEHIKESGAKTVATGNPGCQMQIGAGLCLAGIPINVCHPIELLDEAYRRAGLYDRSGVKTSNIDLD